MNERIKAIRTSLGFNQSQFAAKINAKQNTISRWENGVNEPSDSVIALICKTFGVDEHWLRTGEGEMRKDKTLQEEIRDFLLQTSGNQLDKDAEWLAEFLATSTPEERKMVIAEIRRLSEIVDKNPGE